MRIINPIGRKIDTSFAANNVINACMCHTQNAFLTARTTADTCGHCGCQCGIILSDGNFLTASGTNRTS